MKTYIVLFLLLCLSTSHAQFGTSQPCHENVNNGASYATNRFDIKGATFRISVDWGSSGSFWCTGTLINRDVADADIGDYFIMSRHCVTTWNGSSQFDPNAIHVLSFNYESPDAANASTPAGNRGNSSLGQTTAQIPVVTDGNEYQHRSRIEVVAWYAWGDFALCRIVTPLPQHFNVFYAGWSPTPLVPGPNGSGTCLDKSYAGIHHPSGDIKKISVNSRVNNTTTPIATGCYWVSTVINAVLNFFGGGGVSLTQICNYVDNPWLVVPNWCNGGIEGGSSGSGLFNANNRYIGNLSGGLFTCNLFQPTTYGKFSNLYPATTVRNILNPSSNFGLDITGLPGRRISCRSNLNLPGAAGTPGDYFPANHYFGPHNTIHLQASNDINVVSRIFVHSGANYEFTAGNQINLGTDFTAANGSSVRIAAAPGGGCPSGSISSPREAPQENFVDQIKTRLKENPLPKEKKFDAKGFKEKHYVEETVSLFPNPSNGTFSIRNDYANTEVEISISDLTGKLVYHNIIASSQGAAPVTIEDLGLDNGVYLLKATTKHSVTTHKLILSK